MRTLGPLSLLICAVEANAGPAAVPGTLTVATWNLEWLIAPADFKKLKTDCAPAGTSTSAGARQLPCDVAHRFERSSRDFAMLARYARALNADVVALQEVDGIPAARLVFPGYEFCFTGRSHVQNNGFAIRAGVPHRCGPDYKALSLGDSLRRGAELVLFPGEPYETWLLAIHLKSGCQAGELGSAERACRELGRQVPALAAWIRAQTRAGRRFAVLGDFNRELINEPHRPAQEGSQGGGVWAQIEAGDPSRPGLVNAATGQGFHNCVPGQGYAAYIDHIVISRTLAAAFVPGSFRRITYSAPDARRAQLSDHCPVSIRLRIEQIAIDANTR